MCLQEIAALDAAANELYKENQQLNKQQIALNTEVRPTNPQYGESIYHKKSCKYFSQKQQNASCF